MYTQENCKRLTAYEKLSLERKKSNDHDHHEQIVCDEHRAQLGTWDRRRKAGSHATRREAIRRGQPGHTIDDPHTTHTKDDANQASMALIYHLKNHFDALQSHSS